MAGVARNRKLLALVVLAILVAALGVTRLASAAPGNNGTVKIHEGSAEPSPVTRNEPHVCTFHVHALFFDANQTLTFVVRSWPPTGDRSVVLSGALQTDGSGAGRAPLTGAYSLPDGHYKLFVDTDGSGDDKLKHKVFWVKCAAATTTTGATTTTSGATTTTSGATSTSGVTSTSGATTTTVGATTTTAKATTTTSGATTTSQGATSSSVGGTSSAAPSSSVGAVSSTQGGALPFTGASMLPLLVAGLVLLGIGAASLRATARRRAA